MTRVRKRESIRLGVTSSIGERERNIFTLRHTCLNNH
jgi:hypothetical protein